MSGHGRQWLPLQFDAMGWVCAKVAVAVFIVALLPSVQMLTLRKTCHAINYKGKRLDLTGHTHPCKDPWITVGEQ